MQNIIMTLTGPTASGKTTLERKLVESGVFARVVSTTTREMREGEVDGVDYNYIHYNDFMRLVDTGNMVESIVFDGNEKCYGIQASEVKKCFEQNKPVIAVVEPGGAMQISEYAKKHGLKHIAIYITNTLGELIERFISRDPTMDDETRLRRIDNLISNEMHWEKIEEWDIVIERFDSENEIDVMDFLTNMIHSARLSKVS